LIRKTEFGSVCYALLAKKQGRPQKIYFGILGGAGGVGIGLPSTPLPLSWLFDLICLAPGVSAPFMAVGESPQPIASAQHKLPKAAIRSTDRMI
jgi:hypothetical protein